MAALPSGAAVRGLQLCCVRGLSKGLRVLRKGFWQRCCEAGGDLAHDSTMCELTS